MPYCRRCGTKLDEDAHFCHKCGTPVATYTSPAPSAPMKPIRNDPIIIAAIALVALLVVGVVVAALLAAPFSNVNIGQTIQDKTVNVDKLNLNFESTAAKVNVFAQNIDNNNFVVSISGSASKGVFGGDAGNPVQVTIYNDTVNGVQAVTVKLEESTAFSRYNIVCNVYVNPALTLNLNVTSQAGQVSLTADKPATFQSLNLQASVGTVEANLQNVTVAGNVTLRTQAGTVDLRMSQVNIEGNNTVNLHSNAGSVTMDITETKTL
ncbi:MAG: zinc ribbon domain-containing protein, partial [Chloroflexi bacterium]|nr:zinc ribbon domain-containing protein [Chloroflexota bacterium]